LHPNVAETMAAWAAVFGARVHLTSASRDGKQANFQVQSELSL
jgi:hypothetical protein